MEKTVVTPPLRILVIPFPTYIAHSHFDPFYVAARHFPPPSLFNMFNYSIKGLLYYLPYPCISSFPLLMITRFVLSARASAFDALRVCVFS